MPQPHSIQALADKYHEIDFIGCPGLVDEEVIWLPKSKWLVVSVALYKYLKSEEDNHDRSTLFSIYITYVINEPIQNTPYVHLLSKEDKRRLINK